MPVTPRGALAFSRMVSPSDGTSPDLITEVPNAEHPERAGSERPGPGNGAGPHPLLMEFQA